MNTLKASITIHCGACGVPLKRTKTIKVAADNKEDAIAEAQAKVKAWQASLVGQYCPVCKSIIASVKGGRHG